MTFWARKPIGKVGPKFFSCGKWKGYEKLLVSNWFTSGVDKITAQDEYENAMKGDMDLDKNLKIR